MSDQELAKKILSLVGGKKNIKNVASCMTRLRLSLNDVSLANIDELKKQHLRLMHGLLKSLTRKKDSNVRSRIG